MNISELIAQMKVGALKDDELITAAALGVSPTEAPVEGKTPLDTAMIAFERALAINDPDIGTYCKLVFEKAKEYPGAVMLLTDAQISALVRKAPTMTASNTAKSSEGAKLKAIKEAKDSGVFDL
jgi:hypothetical protein